VPSLRSAVVAVVVAAGAVATALVVLDRGGVPSILDTTGCTAEVDGHTVEVDLEQAENAALIAAVSVRRGMPARAASIALATAFQESKLYNIDYGDRDSVGLFQQRPSQGWGTKEEILDPEHSINAFYDALEKIDGYEDMRITEAAQAVQRSGYPEAYEEHAAGARALASALTGYSPGDFSCVVDEPSGSEEKEGASGLTPRAEAVRADLEAAFGDLPIGGFAAGGVRTGHMPGSAHYDGRALDVFVRPVSDENKRKGWAIASYLVAHAGRLSIDHVIFDDRIWSAGRTSEQGWRDYEPPREGATATERAILEHRDHVHVDVIRGT
jgi:hypothetical protein